VKVAVILLDDVPSTLNGFLGVDRTPLGNNDGPFDEDGARCIIISTAPRKE